MAFRRRRGSLSPRGRARLKGRIEGLLRRHGYRRDDRPDHREWSKVGERLHSQVRLDKDNPEGFNGFELVATTYLRWPIKSRHIEPLLRFLREEFGEAYPGA